MDEITVQVLKEAGRDPTFRSYMWVMRTDASKKPAVYFQYDAARGRSVAQKLLSSYWGIVQTGGCSCYDFIDSSPNMQHAGCWAHSRRKFHEVTKALNKNRKKKSKNGHAAKALQYIGQLYRNEHKADQLEIYSQERATYRQKHSKSVLDQFYQWLNELQPQTPPKGLLGKAVSCTLNQWPDLTLFVESGYISLDNNPAENAIRPFVIGRKNWLFCDTVAGAKTSARLYNLIETARANGLNPYDYFKTLFGRLPLIESEDQLKSLLPQYLKDTPSDSGEKKLVN